jgi:glycosyltransferase involved in cell wall biosynthesis
MYFTVIVPVYNRPDEIHDLLTSLAKQTYIKPYEVLIVDDGSTVDCKNEVKMFEDFLDISYYYKENSGPGDSRNYGMRKAKGDYFLILDSDCILPDNYLEEVEKSLDESPADCFGGIDSALDTFSDMQKAINFAMTSVFTTGGVRGASEKLGKFQPRSFNMGISRKAFEASGGFGNIHPGEDPDLSIRLWKMGFETRLFGNVSVFHKRRISWKNYHTQVSKFGKVRPILDRWHPGYFKITFLFPSFFILGLLASVFLAVFNFPWLLYFYLAYFGLCFIASAIQNRSLKIGAMSLRAVFIQFFGYGTGYLLSFWKVIICRKKPEKAFPYLFFKKK